MDTINKCDLGYYKRIPLSPKGGGTSVFAIKEHPDDEGFNMYLVVVPDHSKWDEGCPAPSDGHVICVCNGVNDAKMIAAAVNIAHGLIASKADIINSLVEDKCKSLDNTYDTSAMSREIGRLREEGKSDEEICEIMRGKRESFLRKKPETKNDGGEW